MDPLGDLGFIINNNLHHPEAFIDNPELDVNPNVDEVMSYDQFKNEFLSRYLINGNVSKNAARTFWSLFRQYLTSLKAELPSQIRANMPLRGFDKELEEFTSDLPKVKMDFAIEDTHKDSDNIIKLIGVDKFPLGEYPRSRYKLVHEMTYSSVQEVLQYQAKFHQDQSTMGRNVYMGWDDVPENGSNSVSISTVSMSIKECNLKPLPVRSSKTFKKIDGKPYLSTDELLGPVIDELNEGRHNVISWISDKPVINSILTVN